VHQKSFYRVHLCLSTLNAHKYWHYPAGVDCTAHTDTSCHSTMSVHLSAVSFTSLPLLLISESLWEEGEEESIIGSINSIMIMISTTRELLFSGLICLMSVYHLQFRGVAIEEVICPSLWFLENPPTCLMSFSMEEILTQPKGHPFELLLVSWPQRRIFLGRIPF